MSDEAVMNKEFLYSFIRGRYRMFDSELRFLLDKSEAQFARYQASCQGDKEALAFFDYIRNYRKILKETLKDDKFQSYPNMGFYVVVSTCKKRSIFINYNSYNITFVSYN